MAYKNVNKDLSTYIGEKVSNKERTLLEHPNPMFEHASYISLNGLWEYKITTNPNDRIDYDGVIKVPYPIESKASLVQKELKKGEYIVYHKTINFEEVNLKEKVILTFLCIDQEATIYLNDNNLGTYANPYLPIKVDITNYINKLTGNDLVVVVKDDLDFKYSYGKQSKKPGGIFYTTCSGIIQSVYLETFGKDYIKDFKIDTNIEKKELYIDVDTTSNSVECVIFDNDVVIHKETYGDSRIVVKFDNIKLWDVNNPYLYNMKLKTKDDEVKTYFGFREIKIKENKIYLNGNRIIFNGVLDQGYYPEGIYTVSDYSQYKDDIMAMKNIGFNTLRKHAKIEPPYFYYLCDKLGMLVMQDFVNNGNKSFFRDAILPNIGFINKNDKRVKVKEEVKNSFINSCINTINELYNHPSIVYWTIFNEGWGQFEADRLYDIIKEKDSTRIIDSTSGWYWQSKSDVDSYHIYRKKLKVKESTRPIIISEFGAYMYKVKDHAFSLGQMKSYHSFKTINKYQEAFHKLYDTEVVPLKNVVSGFIYTQLSDVEEEENGILTYDRKINKLKEFL